MKVAQFILIIFTIFCNEIGIDLMLSDDLKVSILDTSVEESPETEKQEVEVEAESDFVDASASFLPHFNKQGSDLERSISNIRNPFLEVHSPPPEHALG